MHCRSNGSLLQIHLRSIVDPPAAEKCIPGSDFPRIPFVRICIRVPEEMHSGVQFSKDPLRENMYLGAGNCIPGSDFPRIRFVTMCILGASRCPWVRSTEYEIRNANYGIRNMEYELRNTEYKVGNSIYKVQRTKYNAQSTKCKVQSTKYKMHST